ncbi:sugar MFS transporter [Pseudoalteromonas fenneropenaei]|uniref:Sugar MFS transporter n=1 Tax=Pseudoalteromonas fenneropenaei TaxID=1737459 RepID=A0ABV7CNY4_9GAMM
MAITLIEQGQTQAGQRQPVALAWLTTLFFLWGFITCLNDILIPHLKDTFALSYSQAMLVQFCFFGAYFLVSLPAGKLIEKIGYQNGIVTGLLVAGLGCALFYPAAQIHTYALFLGALFVLAAGITILQVSANPYVATLGDKETASSRLTMTQAFNSLGTTIAPFFGALLILDKAAAAGVEDASSVQLPYLMLAASFVVLAVVFKCLKLPKLAHEASSASPASFLQTLKEPQVLFGVLAIFGYVGAEVAIGSFMVNFLMLDEIAALSESQAASYLAYYWGGAMVGRFIGAMVMQKVSAAKVLAFNGVAAVALILVAVFAQGSIAMWALLLVGLCNSIMFPTIFSLAVSGLGIKTAQASGLLCLAIVGGAIIPLVQGQLADLYGIQFSLLVPVVCYVYIAFYGRYIRRQQATTA